MPASAASAAAARARLDFLHPGPAGDHDQVARLPAAGQAVEVVEAGGDAGQPAPAGSAAAKTCYVTLARGTTC